LLHGAEIIINVKELTRRKKIKKSYLLLMFMKQRDMFHQSPKRDSPAWTFRHSRALTNDNEKLKRGVINRLVGAADAAHDGL